eukprot:485817-Rhodomonas_salina.3
MQVLDLERVFWVQAIRRAPQRPVRSERQPDAVHALEAQRRAERRGRMSEGRVHVPAVLRQR